MYYLCTGLLKPCEKGNMRKIEIVSLVLVIVAVVVLIVGLQMDYGNTRKWMGMLFIALLMLAMDPTHFLKRKKKPKIVEEPKEAEEDETGFIDLASAMPVDKNTLIPSYTYLSFLDKESEDYYYIHYVDGKSDEVYVGVAGSLVRQDNDELYEFYVTLDDLLETAENEEIEDLCMISAEDFTSVRTRYQDQMVSYYQTSSPIQVPPEPVNRVGKVVGYLFGAFAFVVICCGAAMLPFMTEVDGGTYIGIFFLFGLILLIAFFYMFSPITWLERRIKWLVGSVNVKVETIGGGKTKSYYADDKENHITYEYHPWEKLMMITKTIQIPLTDAKQEYEQQQNIFKDWIADKSFIEHSYMSELGLLGVYYFYITIPKADAKKAAMKELREWIFLPAHDASKVCECFKFEEAEGTFYVKYQDCRIDKLIYVPENGMKEIFDPEVNTLQDETLSIEMKRFYVDFEDYYARRIKENQRIELNNLPSLN